MNHSIVAEKIRIILKFVGYTLATGFAGSLLIVALALQGSPANYWHIGGWFALSSLNFLVRYLAFVRTKGLSPAERVSLSTRAWVHTFLSGCIWGASVILFMPTLSATGQIAFLVTLFGLNITSIPLMSDIRGISVLFLPAWIPMVFVLYLTTGSITLPLVIAFMLGCVYLVAYIIKTTLDEFIEVRLQRDQAVEELSRTNTMQMSLFLAATHDFRQPMQSISFYLMSMRKRLPADAAELTAIVGMIEERIENMHHLIDETIGFAKLSLNLDDLSVDAVTAADLVATLQANFRQSAESKGLRFRVRCSRNCTLQVNRQILDRILDNLVSNALRNTRRGGILIAFRKRGTSCSVQIWDTGFGIPEYEQERVFDAFYQGKRNGQGARKGHGLGLMIVKRLCERIDADLTLSSRVDHGTVFRLKLPLAPSPRLPLPHPLPSSENRRFDGQFIAIVDDDLHVRRSLKALLTDAGMTVVDASNRSDLMSALQGAPQVRVLVTDLHLERDYGDDIVSEVRQHYPRIRSIVLTADTSEDTQARLKSQALTVLLKPVSPAALLDKVAELTGSAAQEAPTHLV